MFEFLPKFPQEHMTLTKISARMCDKSKFHEVIQYDKNVPWTTKNREESLPEDGESQIEQWKIKEEKWRK
jgi:hypothetical protein